MKYTLHSFGCKVNTYDSGLIQKNMLASNFESRFETSEKNKQGIVHVLNTCAVTAEATKEAVRLIRKIKSQDPLATIVVTGCAAQVDTEIFSNLPSVNMVVANSHKGMLPLLIEKYFKGEIKDKVFKSNIFRKEDLEAGGGTEEKHSRAFLKIQDGCNSFCSFCIIPYARGKSRSIAVSDLVQRINELHHLDYQEVVLTGVHIGDYLDDSAQTPFKLEDLIENVLHKTSIPRIRLTSLEPIELNDRLLDLYSDARLCPHFHMSIQSTDSKVLSEMKRKYDQQTVVGALNKIQKRIKNAYIGMDVIAGFPTETEIQFEESYRVLSETAWTKLHVFPYSERSGTKAAVMPETVPVTDRKIRAQKLRVLSLHRMQSEALKQIQTRKKILLLKNSNSNNQMLTGISRDFWNVKLEKNKIHQFDPQDIKEEVEVNINAVNLNSSHSDVGLVGEIVKTELVC